MDDTLLLAIKSVAENLGAPGLFALLLVYLFPKGARLFEQALEHRRLLANLLEQSINIFQDAVQILKDIERNMRK